MNYAEDIASILGLELGELFKLKHLVKQDVQKSFKLDKDALWRNDDGEWVKVTGVLLDIIFGHVEIAEKPWKPQKYGDGYYSADSSGSINNEWLAVYSEWQNSSTDYMYYAMGNCFETEEEAEEAIPRMQEIIKRLSLGGRLEVSE